jgi:hypothetical protein
MEFEIPAFPVPYENYHEGMTLRDYFAAAVLNGLFSRESTKTDREEKVLIADFAYDMADRMIKVREEALETKRMAEVAAMNYAGEGENEGD